MQQFPSVDNLCDQIGIGLCSLDSKEANSSHCRHWQVAAKKKGLKEYLLKIHCFRHRLCFMQKKNLFSEFDKMEDMGE